MAPLARFLPALALAALALCAPARGVVVAGGDGTQNTVAPADDFGFANVGRVNTLCCVYLGEGWVLTAYHVLTFGSSQTVAFRDPAMGQQTFTIEPGSAVRLRNADDSFTDLALFHLTSTPGFLTPVTLAAATPAAGTAVVLAGGGVNRGTAQTLWDADQLTGGVWTETGSAMLADHRGYKWAGGQTTRWGANTLEAGTVNVNAGFGAVRSVVTDFDDLAGEAQAGHGDSGGGLFVKNGGAWELAGIMHATGAFAQQPGNTSVFGNVTYAADLPTYRAQILATVPEPSTAALLALGGALAGARRRRTL